MSVGEGVRGRAKAKTETETKTRTRRSSRLGGEKEVKEAMIGTEGQERRQTSLARERGSERGQSRVRSGPGESRDRGIEGPRDRGRPGRGRASGRRAIGRQGRAGRAGRGYEGESAVCACATCVHSLSVKPPLHAPPSPQAHKSTSQRAPAMAMTAPAAARWAAGRLRRLQATGIGRLASRPCRHGREPKRASPAAHAHAHILMLAFAYSHCCSRAVRGQLLGEPTVGPGRPAPCQMPCHFALAEPSYTAWRLYIRVALRALLQLPARLRYLAIAKGSKDRRVPFQASACSPNRGSPPPSRSSRRFISIFLVPPIPRRPLRLQLGPRPSSHSWPTFNPAGSGIWRLLIAHTAYCLIPASSH